MKCLYLGLDHVPCHKLICRIVLNNRFTRAGVPFVYVTIIRPLMTLMSCGEIIKILLL